MIDSFSGEYRFLSNFHYAPFEWKGCTWPTVEHAFQASKTKDPEKREAIRQAATPGQAKRLGRAVELREDWEQVKDSRMGRLVLLKFRQHPDLAKQLLATCEQNLVEGNHWHDLYWGKCYCGVHAGFGKNRLGMTLMQTRAELQREGT